MGALVTLGVMIVQIIIIIITILVVVTDLPILNSVSWANKSNQLSTVCGTSQYCLVPTTQIYTDKYVLAVICYQCFKVEKKTWH